MSGSLQQTLIDVVNAFNAHDPLVESFLADNVKLVTVRTHTTITPKSEVVLKMASAFANNATFTVKQHPPVSFDVSAGTIKGMGIWTEDYPSNPPATRTTRVDPLPFRFTLILNGVDWLFTDIRTP